MNTSESQSALSAEELLQQNQEQYVAYFEGSSDTILVHDDQGSITDANTEASRVLGYSKEELLDMNIADLEVGLEIIATQKDWASFLKANSLILQRDFRKKDGTTFPVEIHYRSFDKNGESFYECTIKDVTERNLLRIRERNRAKILEQLAGDMDIFTIMRSIVRSIEEEDATSICTILLYDKETHTLGCGTGPGMPDFYNEAIDGISVGEGIGSCGTAAATKQLVCVDNIGTHPYWSAFKELAFRAGVQSCWSQPILSSSNEMVGTFAIYHREPRTPQKIDLERIAYGARFANLAIENRRIRAEILEHKNHLEKLVAERTEALVHANEELEAFSYSVSHDLRAPLRAIAGFSNIMMEDYGDKLDAEGQKTLNTIVNNALRMGNLIDDILSFSKLSRAKKINSSLDMKAIFRAVFEELMRQEPAGHKVVFELGELAPAVGDQAMITQVVTNFVSNALKYSRNTPETRIVVYSKITGDSITYTVKDNGAGFDEKYKNKLFKIFSRLHNDKDFEGTGIGPSIVKKVIDRHGGVVSAEGALGEGATFSFSLPIV
ncbi:PAS domain S-box-containing protein [Mucilaginibacter yixingensis]|uniref:histidine kinase n=1 Tax=Mucilaginibacter yixingensis TaxID=1295612 RepID=A0A2T5JDA9_9SPHI|nr:ATP-binding protein [Mucilaginibacter yixingensis]PTQ99746.1 PAS domain S-box-containing protein [Mucilaginibacter yixingensis]